MRSPAREGDPAAHPSFKEARRLGPLTQLSQKVGTLLAMVLVMGALTWPPLTWGLWTLPTWAVWRPLGAFLTGWNKRMHPCIVDLFYRLFGVKMLLYGDTPAAEPVYFMANHQHYHDNVTVISALAARVRGVSGAGIRWLAKKALMIQPLGWSMYLSGEVMLSRVYARDVAKIQTAVRGLRTERHFPAGTKTSWLVVFPEGTRITRRALVASQRFMAEQGLAPPDRPLRHLLCPRFKGTQMILKEARGTFTAVYDVTIGYKPLPAHNNWRMPKEVHVHLKRIPMDSIGLTDAEVKSWLLGRWRTKDELLQHFYTHGSFPGTSAVHSSGLARTVATLCGTVALNLVLTLGWWRIMRRLVTKLLLLRRR